MIDPMHNLFLGTAKTVFKLWLEKKILIKQQLKVVEERIKQMNVGTGFGRLPHKISASYGGYTASQLKTGQHYTQCIAFMVLFQTIISTAALHL